MVFKEKKFGQPGESMEREEQGKEEIEKLKNLASQTAESLRLKGVPVEDNCRIDMRSFAETYSEKEINNDIEVVKGFERKFASQQGLGPLSLQEWEEQKLKTAGEKLEIVKTVIFNKFLGDDFITARSSRYDDISNGVDNIIFEKQTGNLICALDEVGDARGDAYERKRNEVLAKNVKGKGARLKYGVQKGEPKTGADGLTFGKAENLPIFYLVLPSDHISKAIEQMSSSLEEKTDYENKLFAYFLSSFEFQIKALRLKKVDPEFERKISHFEEVLERMK